MNTSDDEMIDDLDPRDQISLRDLEVLREAAKNPSEVVKRLRENPRKVPLKPERPQVVEYIKHPSMSVPDILLVVVIVYFFTTIFK